MTTDPVEVLKVLSAESYNAKPSFVWQCIMREFGGAEGLAREVALTFKGTDQGGANRVRLLVAVLNGVLKLDPSEGEGDEDLDALRGQLAGYLASNPELISGGAS